MGRRAGKIEGRQGEYCRPELTQLKRRADGDGRPDLFLQEPSRLQKCLFSLRLNICLVYTWQGRPLNIKKGNSYKHSGINVLPVCKECKAGRRVRAQNVSGLETN